MKYVITGSIGHISKPIVQALVAAGHQVTVLTSNQARVAAIEALGANGLVGNIEEREFVAHAFAGADAVYLMIPPKWTVTDWLGYQKGVADNYLAAIKSNHISKVVVLSSVGAHLGTGCGPVDGTANLEKELSKLTDVNVHALRPSYFYYNLFSQIGIIKHAGIVTSTQPADFLLALTHTNDIADAAIAALLRPDFKGYNVQYIASDEKTWSEIAKSLGTVVGKPEVPYVQSTDEQSREGMLQAGLSPVIAAGYEEMGKALREGKMQEDYLKHRPQFGKVKLADFVKEFAVAYSAS